MFRQYHRSLRNELKQRPKYDIIFSCELYSLRASAWLKKRTGSKLIYDAREIYTGLPTLLHKPIKRWLWKRWEASGLTATDIVLITAPHDGEEIERVHGFLPRSLLVRNLPMTSSLPQSNNFLRELFPAIGNERKVLVYVGGLQEDRGLPEMIEAMTSLRKEMTLVLIGSGTLQKSLEEKVANKGLTKDVFFLLPIESEVVLSVLASADIGISLVDTRSLSYSFALPSKIFEYIRAGIPVLTADLCEVKALFGTQDWIRYTSLDSSAIVENIRALASLSRYKGDIQTASEGFSFENDADPLFDLLNI
jgi:glycosyltransferase involved in cell wall biosynthesis